MIIGAYILLVVGCFFALAGTIGVLRMPDAFCRMQSSTNIATLGVLGAVFGGALYAFSNGNAAMGIKVILIGLFIVLTNPIAGHAIARAAYRYGIRPEKKMACDEYGRDIPNE
jgi:multicomponent Na+:H+ antiporter subunit G